MTRLRAMIVTLLTELADDSATKEQLYVGLWGTGGGREFPLRSKGFDAAGGSFAAGWTRVFKLGDFAGVVTPPEGRESHHAGKGEPNDPGLVADRT